MKLRKLISLFFYDYYDFLKYIININYKFIKFFI